MQPAEFTVQRESNAIHAWLEANAIDYIAAYLNLKEIMSSRFGINAPDVETLVCIVNDENNPLGALLSEFASQLAPFPWRAVQAPFACSTDAVIRERTRTVPAELVGLETKSSFCVDKSRVHLTNKELRYWLGLSQLRTALVAEKFLEPTYRGGTRVNYDYPEITRFYATVSDVVGRRGSTRQNTLTIDKYCGLHKVKIAEALQEASLSTATNIHWSSDVPLSQASVVTTELDDSQSARWLTLEETCQYLGTYGEAVRSVRDHGLLPYTRQTAKNNRYSFALSDVEAFSTEYVLIGELAGRVGESSKHLSEKLKAIGIEPVSGPRTDGGSIYVFRREDISSEALQQAASLDSYATQSGRPPQGAAALDQSKWATAAEVSEILRVPRTQLHRITKRGLLEEGEPIIRDSRRRKYFKKDSIPRTQAFLKSLIPVNKIASEVENTRWKVLRRLSGLFDAKPIDIGPKDYMTPEQARAVTEHFHKYVDSKYLAECLGVSDQAVRNLRLQGHLSPIPPEDPGFIDSQILFEREAADTFIAAVSAGND